MKRLFICVVLAVLPFTSESSDLERARRELETAREEMAKFSVSREKERRALLKEYSEERSKFELLSQRLSNLECEREKLGLLGEELRYRSGEASEIYSNAASFGGNFFRTGSKWRSDMEDSSEFAIRVLDEIMDRAVYPLKLVEETAKTRDGREIAGKSFRLGENRYFVSGEICGFLSGSGVLFGEEKADGIRDFAEGKSDLIPLPSRAGPEKTGIMELIKLGGIWMWPILAFGAVSLFVFFVKGFQILRIRRINMGAVEPVFSALSRGDGKSAAEISESVGIPYSNLLAGLVKGRNLGASTLEEISYEHMLSAGEKLFYGLGVLSVSSTVAPLLGLLGTVTGIIKTFADISARGSGDPELISGGISEALLTTEYGLIVAIPSFVAHALLSRRARAIMGDMEKLSSTFISKISK